MKNRVFCFDVRVSKQKWKDIQVVAPTLEKAISKMAKTHKKELACVRSVYTMDLNALTEVVK